MSDVQQVRLRNSGSHVSDHDVVASVVTMTLLELPSTAAPMIPATPAAAPPTALPPIEPFDAVTVDAVTVEADDDPVGTSFARCADGNGTLTHLFFSDDEFDIARAKAICAKCGLAPTCLSGALDRAEAYGVWGGQLLIDGEIVAVKRGRGRPPKTPRPALVVDEVPVPPHLVA